MKSQNSRHNLLELDKFNNNLDNEFISDLFMHQIKELTFKTNRRMRAMDRQFSDFII